MRAIIWLISGAALVLVLGCRDKQEQVQGEEYGKTVEEGEARLEQPPVDIAEERDTFLSEVEQRVNDLDRKIQELERSADEQAQNLKQKLVQERQELNQAMAEARRATAENWAQAKQEVNQAIGKLQKAYEGATTALENEGEGTTSTE